MQDQVEPLCIVKASCMGAEFVLDRDFINFGNVVFGCSYKQNLVLFNTGDIGGRFQWKSDRSEPFFHLSPIKGYISPQSDVLFNVVFTPQNVNSVCKENASRISSQAKVTVLPLYFLNL